MTTKEQPRQREIGFSPERQRVKERLVTTLGNLVGFRTVSASHEAHAQDFQGLFGYVDAKVQEAKENGRQYLSRQWENDGRISTIITPYDPSRSEEESLLQPKIAILIHADVVDAEDPSLFTVRRDSENVYGRGVYDMKQGLAIGLDLLPELPVGAALVITSDEEVGGSRGAEFLAKESGLRPEFLIVLDGQKSEHLSLGAKAAWHTKVTFHSLLNEGGHGSRYEDYSANELAMDLRNVLREYYPWRYSNSPSGTTFNVGVMEGGVATNKVAQDARIQVDMRFPSQQDKEQGENNLQSSLLRITQERLQDVYGDNVPVALNFVVGEDDSYQLVATNTITHEEYVLATVDTLARTPLYAIDPNNRLVKRFGEILEQVTGEPIKINDKDTGAHDGSNWPDVPAIVYMPRGGGAHKNTEWLSAESLYQTREAIGQLLQEELG